MYCIELNAHKVRRDRVNSAANWINSNANELRKYWRFNRPVCILLLFMHTQTGRGFDFDSGCEFAAPTPRKVQTENATLCKIVSEKFAQTPRAELFFNNSATMGPALVTCPPKYRNRLLWSHRTLIRKLFPIYLLYAPRALRILNDI